MPGSTRHSSPRLPAGGGVGDRDAATESLLLTGLDFYFGGQYERAIHAWTRVLFIDRGHARARAYIDRARRVLAERQREADELLHGGLAAFDEGDADTARAMLTSLVQRGNADDLALAVLQRMDRLEAAARPVAATVVAEAGAAGPSPGTTEEGGRGARVNRGLIAAAGVFLVGAVLLVFGWEPFGAWLPRQQAVPGADRPATVAEAGALPLPSVSELTLAQARTLFTRGHLHEALRAVETIRLDDRRRSEADALRTEIQRALIAATAAGAGEAMGPPTPSPPHP
jgi:hypothetical protein